MNVWRKKVSVSRCTSHRPSLPLFPTFTLFPPRKTFAGTFFHAQSKKERSLSLLNFHWTSQERNSLSYPCPFTFDCQKVHIIIIIIFKSSDWLTTEETKIDSRHAQTPRKFILRNRYLVYLKLPRRPITNTFWVMMKTPHLARCQNQRKFHTFHHLSPITKK
jgi:hypothetical protein